MAPTYLVEMTKEEAEGFGKLGYNLTEHKPEIISPNANIVKHDYIKLGIKNIENNFDENKGFNIAINPTEHNLNWEQQNISLLEKGLYMSNPKEFMEFHNSVIYAYKSKKPLFDAAGNEVKRDIVEGLYRNLTSNEWTNLNMKFVKNNKGIWTTQEAIGLNKDKNIIYNTNKIKVSVSKDAYVNPKFLTKDGMPRKKLEEQTFKRGENIYFWSPVEGRVARFDAGGDVAVLGCGGGPSNAVSNLGVRASERRE